MDCQIKYSLRYCLKRTEKSQKFDNSSKNK